jgi:hypothetical protein
MSESKHETPAPEPTHAERARALASARTAGALSTLAKDPEGHPYGSLVSFAMHGSEPVFFLSTLAVHTQHLARDARASLLIADLAGADPLASERVTLLGRCVLDPTDAARDAYLRVHPDAARYLTMRDFAIWRLSISSIRYIGGFGRMSWVDVEAWRAAPTMDASASAQER